MSENEDVEELDYCLFWKFQYVYHLKHYAIFESGMPLYI